jgi:hypothetical protein
MEAAGPASWPAERPGLSLLAAADVRGRVSLWLQGQVQVAELTAAVMPRASLAGDAADDDGLQEREEEERYRLLHVSCTQIRICFGVWARCFTSSDASCKAGRGCSRR